MDPVTVKPYGKHWRVITFNLPRLPDDPAQAQSYFDAVRAVTQAKQALAKYTLHPLPRELPASQLIVAAKPGLVSILRTWWANRARKSIAKAVLEAEAKRFAEWKASL